MFTFTTFTAARVNDACNSNTSCISPFALCEGVCRCLDIFVPTKDGRCKLPDISFVGEVCSLDECEYPATCVGGVCRCVGEYRAITSEEFWIDPTNIWQCAKNNTSLCKMIFKYRYFFSSYSLSSKDI